MLWFAGAREIVVLARKENNLGRYAEMFEGSIPLLALLNGHAIVVVRMQNQGRSLHVLRVLQRRAVPIQIHLLKNVAAEIGRVSVSSVARSIVRNKIRNTA